MLLTSSDTKRTLMHLFLFTNSAQRELVSICTQSTTAINFPCIKPLRIYIYYILRIAGQTAGQIGIKNVVDAHGWPGGVLG